MGGLGSGRRRTRLGIDECRALELGELCDQGRWRTQSRGEVPWRSRHGGEIRARLSYVISGQESAAGKLLLTYRYRREGADLSFEHEVELDCSPGERSCASCPACGRHVRSLYAPTGADLFACRSCWGSYERAAASASSRLRNWRIETTFSSRKATCGEATGDGSLEVRPGKS